MPLYNAVGGSLCMQRLLKGVNFGTGLRKLLLATGCPSLPGGGTEPSRAAKGPLPSWQTPLFCLSSESGQVALLSSTHHTSLRADFPAISF